MDDLWDAFAYGRLAARIESVRNAGPRQSEELLRLFEALDELEAEREAMNEQNEITNP